MSVCLRDLADVSYYGARSCLLFMCVCLIHQCHSQTPKLVTCFPIFCATKALSNAVKQNWRISAWNGSFQNLSEFFVCTLPLAVLTWYLAKSETSRWMAGHKEDQTRPTFQVIKQCGGKNKQSAVKTMKWSRTSWRGLELLRLVPIMMRWKMFFCAEKKTSSCLNGFCCASLLYHLCITSASPLYHPWATFLFWSQVGTWWWCPSNLEWKKCLIPLARKKKHVNPLKTQVCKFISWISISQIFGLIGAKNLILLKNKHVCCTLLESNLYRQWPLFSCFSYSVLTFSQDDTVLSRACNFERDQKKSHKWFVILVTQKHVC